MCKTCSDLLEGCLLVGHSVLQAFFFLLRHIMMKYFLSPFFFPTETLVQNLCTTEMLD